MTAFGYALPNSTLTYASGATGDDAMVLHRQFRDRELEQSASISLLPPTARLASEIDEAFIEAGEAGWAGPGTLATTLDHLAWAREFLSLIPTDWPLPEVAVDPDGEFDFEWRIDKDHVFSVSVGLSGELSYAGLFGRSRVHGIEYLGSGSIGPVLESIRRLYREVGSPCPA